MGSAFGSTSDPASGQSPTSATVRDKFNYLKECFAKLWTMDLTDSAAVNTGAKGSLYLANTTSGITALTPGTSGKYLQSQGSGADPSYAWGGLVQTAQTTYTSTPTSTATFPRDNTIPQISEGEELFTLSFTPKLSTSILEIDVCVYAANSSGLFGVALFKDATADALAAVHVTNSGVRLFTAVFSHRMASPGTSAITFRVRIGGTNGGTTWINFNTEDAGPIFGGVVRSFIRIKEVQV